MKKTTTIWALALSLGVSGSLLSCDVLQQVATEASQSNVTDAEISGGLKDALGKGTLDAINILSLANGFYDDPLVKIPFPEEIMVVKNTLDKVGLNKVSDAFVKELNKGASHAVKKAGPIFKDAITGMSFADASQILLGDNQAATRYFKAKTSEKLLEAFKPDVAKVLDQYGISKSYSSLMSQYNKIPFVKPANTDLVDYVTRKTLDGLFLKVGEEEQKIRADVGARSTALMQKVFAYADRQNPM